jgi:poly(3-hydroxybutyrate) depolymerase
MTKTMIGVTWHLTTIAFVELGALEIYAAGVSGGASRALELLAAGTATAFAALAIGAGLRHGPAALLRHAGPLALATVAGLTWWGTL